MSIDLTIGPLPTDKEKIKQPDLCKQGIIPPLGASIIFCGATGSGKSNLCATLVTDKRFYKDHFDAVYLFSPTALNDAMQNNFQIPKERIINDPEADGAEALKAIMESQSEAIQKHGCDKCPQIGIVMDDIIQCKRFMKSKDFLKAFIASRHFCITVMILTQSWTRVPRACRIQATAIFYWRGSQSEMELLASEYSPPGYSKRRFLSMVNWITKEPYQFMCINKNQPMKDRFRKGLSEIVDVSTEV